MNFLIQTDVGVGEGEGGGGGGGGGEMGENALPPLSSPTLSTSDDASMR